MNQELIDVLASLSVQGTIQPGDVYRLRDALWVNESVSQSAMEALFDLNDRCREKAREWTDFLVEAVDHYLLHQTAPYGFLDEKGAAWLRARLGRTGKIRSAVEMEVLVAIIENAENAPDWLKAWTLAQLEETVVSGTGVTRSGEALTPNVVDDAEVTLIRRLIFAGGGEGAVVVDALEADMLFRIKERTRDSANAESWLTLFVEAVGNHLMHHSDYRQMKRTENAQFWAFVDQTTPHLSAFFKRTLPPHMLGRGTVAEAFKAVFTGDEAFREGDPEIEEAIALTAEESGWLKEQIAADPKTDDYEKVLLTFVLEEAGNAPALLDGMRLRA